jgi:hypothetical protein
MRVGSRVRYGLSPAQLTEEKSSAVATTEHKIDIGGLQPATKYYYAIGTETVDLAGGDDDHFFLTAPEPGTSVPTRVWVLGDSGTSKPKVGILRDAYYALTGATHTNLWLMLGDNAYCCGTDPQYQTAVFDMFPEMLRKSVLWPTLGNHDGLTADSSLQSGPYYNLFTLPTAAEAGGVASGTEAYYSFDYGNIHFVCLESFETDRSTDGAMLLWLSEDLDATLQQWIIAYWHHPPYSKAAHDSDTEREMIEMRENAVPILEDAGVDLVLCGHSHAYERSYLLNGHYGQSYTLTRDMVLDCGDGRFDGDGVYEKPVAREVNDGAVYVEAGNSGGQGLLFDLDHPAMLPTPEYSSLQQGSLVLDIDGNRLDARYISQLGEVVDYFSIVKQGRTRQPISCTPVPQVPFRRGDANGDGRINITDAIWIVGGLFLGQPFGACTDASDVDDDGRLILTDAIYAVSALFQGGPPPPPPYPDCGNDTTDDDLTCTAPSRCRP